MSSPRSVLVVAGEASGDRHAARLIGMMRGHMPDLAVWGIGGALLRSTGMEILTDASEMNVIGFVEVVRRYRFFRSTFNRIVAEAVRRRPDVAILVDYPGFNLRLAAALHREGIPVLYYIAPQVWAWKEGRVRKMRDAIDELIVAFPFEVEYFARHGIAAHFFGHPLVDQLAARNAVPAGAAGTAAGPGAPDEDPRPVIAYLPGSRPEEIARHMPIVAGVIDRIGNGYRHVIPLASTIDRSLIEPYRSTVPFELVGSAHEALDGARAALVKSGTSTVEATLLRVPFAVFYRTSSISYAIARHLIKVPFIAMTNVLADRVVVREFVQDDATVDALSAELHALIADGPYRERVAADIAGVAASLGAPGAAERTAAYIVERFLR